MEEELTEEVELAKRRIDEINMELNQVLDTHRHKQIMMALKLIVNDFRGRWLLETTPLKILGSRFSGELLSCSQHYRSIVASHSRHSYQAAACVCERC